MPYASNADLPQEIRDALPEKAQTVFRRVVNVALADGDEESSAFAQAWGAVKNGWEKNKEGEWIQKMAPRPLYVSRGLTNATEIIAWAKAAGFKSTLPAEDMHVTICYSKAPVDWMDAGNSHAEQLNIPKGGPRAIEQFGEGAVVLQFASADLQARHMALKAIGASFDYDKYKPHITISYGAGDVDIATLEPYQGPIVLGHEVFEDLDLDWKDKVTEKSDPTASDVHVPGTDWKEEELKKVHILKADDDRRMVYGWASVITKNGTVVVDTQGDSIEPQELEKATTEFMSDVRKAQEMHNPGVKGMVVHSFPMIADIAKSLGINCDQEGWIVGVKVSDDATWQKVKSGELRAFSIGGQGRREEV